MDSDTELDKGRLLIFNKGQSNVLTLVAIAAGYFTRSTVHGLLWQH